MHWLRAEGQPSSEPQSTKTTTLAALGYQFPEAPGLNIGLTGLELVGKRRIQDGEAYLARTQPITGDELYRALTQIKHHPRSQGALGSVMDWEDPEFRESHEKFSPKKWKPLLQHLDAFIEVVTPPGASAAPWDIAAYDLSGRMLYSYLLLTPDSSQSYWHHMGYVHPAAEGFNQAAIQTTPGSLIDTYHQFYKQNGYDLLVPALIALEKSGLLYRPVSIEETDHIELFNDGNRSWNISRSQLIRIHNNILNPMMKLFLDQQEKLTREFFYSLGDDPAARAMQLMHITYNQCLSETRVDQLITPTNGFKPTSFQRIDSHRIQITNDGHPVIKNLSRDWMHWFYRPTEIKEKKIQPLFCWERSSAGKREYVYDHRRVEALFPGATTRISEPETLPDTLAGLMVLAYTQPQIYGKFPDVLPLPPTYDAQGVLISPPPNPDGSPKTQDMQEGQIPFLVMHRDKQLLTDDVFSPLEQAFIF